MNLLFLLPPVAGASTEIYSFYIHTDEYAEMVKPKILPISCLDILETKFSGHFHDSLFEDAIEGRNCHARLPDTVFASSSHLVNSTIVNIPIDDYIASTEVAEMLFQFLNHAFDVRLEWPNGQHVTNSLAYTLFTELSFKSDCTHIDCRVFQKIVKRITN